jgi:hypothetical protein
MPGGASRERRSVCVCVSVSSYFIFTRYFTQTSTFSSLPKNVVVVKFDQVFTLPLDSS